MITIRVDCPGCGQVDVHRDQLELTITDPAERSTYVFHCPGCDQAVRKQACAHHITLLVAGGVATVVLPLPAEALEPHDGPALTIDDLLDLLLDLARA